MHTMNATKRLLPLLILLPLTGCSTFDRDYQKALKNPPPAGIEGPWDGRWQSQNGHGDGALRALVTRTAPDTYHARFRATYKGVLSADEDVDLHVTSTPTATPIRAAGSADLGSLKGGVYQYDATITPTTLDATYRSDSDHGTFNLTRPKPQ